MPTIEVLDGPCKGQSLTLDRDETIVGRVPYCDLVLNQRNVSRQHTRIVRSGGDYLVEDMNSTNGTFLNGKRVRTRTVLKNQDLIRVYNVTLLFRDDPWPGAAGEAQQALEGSPVKGEAREGAASGISATAQDVHEAATTSRRNVGVNAYDKLKTVLEIQRTVGSTLDVDQVLPKILDGLFTVFPQSDRAYILFPEADTAALQVKALKHKEEGTLALASLGPISQSIANRVMSCGEAILSSDGLSEDLELSDSVLDFPIRSMMCAPLLGRLCEPLGIIYVDTNDPFERFHEDDLEVLLSVAATAGQAVEYARAHQAKLHLDRRERELSTARQVQLHFLPQSRPKLTGYQFFDYYHSAEEVGGDYYGYVRLPDGRLAVTLGDVSGKGISAALIMARLCSEVRYQLVTAATPLEAIRNLNVEFCKPENDSWFVTMVMCLLDPQRHRITLCNAGHMPPLCRRAADGTIQQLGNEVAAPPLGCDPAIEYRDASFELAPGDLVLVYTDGINDAMNPDQELYGLQRLCQTLRSGPSEVNALVDALLQDVRGFARGYPQSDDICLIGLQRAWRA